VGHPFGASEKRYLLTLAISMRERNARYGVLGLCTGSGQGMAVLLENSQWT
jgi:acetyl-CoA acetyltransferase